jgi:hypothetical protein
MSVDGVERVRHEVFLELLLLALRPARALKETNAPYLVLSTEASLLILFSFESAFNDRLDTVPSQRSRVSLHQFQCEGAKAQLGSL